MDEKKENNIDLLINSIVFVAAGFCSAMFSGILIEWFGIRTWTFSFLFFYIPVAVVFYQIMLLFWAMIFGRFVFFRNRQKEFFDKTKGFYKAVRESLNKYSS